MLYEDSAFLDCVLAMMIARVGIFCMLDKSKSVERLVLVIFFFSGLSALVYQVVWQRLLTVHYGVGPISTALVVTVYMVGLGLGALFGGYLSERLRQRMLIYCFIELGIGLFGAVSPDFLGFLGNHTAGSGYALSFVYMFSFLSIPTFLMGMTLPLLTKIFNNIINDFLGALSFLYFINTIGAAVGAIVDSYFSHPEVGYPTRIAAARNTDWLDGRARAWSTRLSSGIHYRFFSDRIRNYMVQSYWTACEGFPLRVFVGSIRLSSRNRRWQFWHERISGAI
jgi:MFS family permease